MEANKTEKRPSQYKQSSRKSKKSWRKNIDLSGIEASIEKKIEHEITYGADKLEDVKDTDLFKVDVAGDEQMKKRLIKRNQIKKDLKSKEILNGIKTASKVQSLTHHKHGEKSKDNKVQGVSKKEMRKLLGLAGKGLGESEWQNRLTKDGLVKAGTTSLWGDDSAKKVKLPSGIELDIEKFDKIPKELLEKSTTGWSAPQVRPETLEHKPIKVDEYSQTPHAGKSYNPSKKDWSQLINKEYKIESAAEDISQAIIAYKKRIQYLMDTIDDDEEQSSSDDEDEENQDDQDDNEENTDVISLSINKPVRNNKKTKYERNKARRHAEQVKLQQELKKIKQRVKELENIENIEIDVDVAHKKNEKFKESQSKKIKKNKKHTLGTKHSALKPKLEIKLSDEISEPLRRLRPESNLLYDTLRKLQSTGQIESRVRNKSKMGKKKITEKWTYKDFK